jgi:hypothetical protein
MGEISSFIECISAEIGVFYCEQKTCKPGGHPIIVFNKGRTSEFSLGFEAMESIENFSQALAFFVVENSIDRDIAKGFTL